MAEAQIAQHLGNIQGNILGGFLKDHQAFLFFQIPEAASGRAWLAEAVGDIAASSSDKVLAFNEKFSLARKRQSGRDPDPNGSIKATWVNVAFTHAGLGRLGISEEALDAFPTEFSDGMAKRAALIGDVDESAPEKWIEPFRSQRVDGVLIVAADRASDCETEVRRQRRRLDQYKVKWLFTQPGNTLDGDQRGHEHFGFKDGISQPGILGITKPSDPSRPDQGTPGQDLIEPGEFVLGYLTERSSAVDPSSSSSWALDGSFLVFRRLRQDVQSFHDFVKKQAAAEEITPDLMGAKLVGRYASGAPLEGAEDQSKDPGRKGGKTLDDAHINSFEYRGDPQGRFVPRAAHIRKAYPRDQVPPGEDETRAHRLLRRGIPYGDSLQEGAPPGSPRAGNGDRGLLFLSYQSSIAKQFEYIQRQMVNNPNFPQPGDGRDPIISQDVRKRTFTLPGGVQDHVTLMKRWVTTTGGDYFFSPSISALRELSTEQPRERRRSMAYNSEYMRAFAKFVVAVWDKRDPGAAFEGIVASQPTPQELVNLAAKQADAHRQFVSTALDGKADTQLNAASGAWKQALAAFNIDPRPGRTVIVHENTSDVFHYVIPEPPTSNPALSVDIAIRGLETLECDM